MTPKAVMRIQDVNPMLFNFVEELNDVKVRHVLTMSGVPSPLESVGPTDTLVTGGLTDTLVTGGLTDTLMTVGPTNTSGLGTPDTVKMGKTMYQRVLYTF